MAEDNGTVAERGRSGADGLAKKSPKTHPALLALARLIGRGMARERCAATAAANDNAGRGPPDDSAAPTHLDSS